MVYPGKVKNMKRTITVNGQIYPAKEFDFNMICDLQDMGIDIGNGAMQMPLIRAYVASCMETTKEVAGKELEAHIISVGNVNNALIDIASVIGEMVAESGFFRALNQIAEEEVTTNTTAKSKAKK